MYRKRQGFFLRRGGGWGVVEEGRRAMLKMGGVAEIEKDTGEQDPVMQLFS